MHNCHFWYNKKNKLAITHTIAVLAFLGVWDSMLVSENYAKCLKFPFHSLNLSIYKFHISFQPLPRSSKELTEVSVCVLNCD